MENKKLIISVLAMICIFAIKCTNKLYILGILMVNIVTDRRAVNYSTVMSMRKTYSFLQ